MTRSLISVALVCVAVPAVAQTAASTTAKPAAAKGLDPNKVICHEDPTIGSRLAMTKECHTRAEWAEIQRQQRADVERSQGANGH